MGWTRRSVGATILQVTERQRRDMARRMSARMEERGLTNETLAYKAGVSVKTVSRMLHAHHVPRVETLRKIAKALGWTEQQLRGQHAPLGLDVEIDDFDETLEHLDGEVRYLRKLMEMLAGDAMVEAARQALEQEDQRDDETGHDEAA